MNYIKVKSFALKAISILGVIILYFLFIVGYPFIFAGYFNSTSLQPDSGYRVIKCADCLAKLKIGVLGDSTAAGQGTGTIERSFSFQYIQKNLQGKYDITYQSFAHSGSKTLDVNDNQLQDLLNFKPDLVFVSIGANDVTGLTPESQFAGKIEYLANKLAELNIKAIWLSIPDFITSPILLPPLNFYLSNTAKRFNEILFKITHEHGFSYIDVFDSTRQAFKDNSLLYFSKDMFHPSPAGYGLWVNQIEKSVKAF